MATQEVEILQVNTEPSKKSIAELRSEIKQLKDSLLSLEQGSKEYNQTLVDLADKQHQLKEIQEEVNRSSTDFGDRLHNVQGVMAGLSGAFQTAIGTLSLMGVELGDDVKMLKMLQSAMAITQGIAAIDTGIKAFKALKASINASAVSAGVLGKVLASPGPLIAVTALVTAVFELVKGLKEAREEAQRVSYEISFGNFAKDLEEYNLKMQTQIELSKMRGATDYEVWKQNKALLEENITATQKALDAITERMATAKKSERKILQEQYDKMNEDLSKMLSQQLALIYQRQIEEEKNQKTSRERRQKNEDAANKHRLSKMELQYNEQVELAEESYQKELAAAGDDAVKIEKAEEKKTKALADINKKYYEDQLKEAKKYRDTLKQRLAAATPDERSSLEAQIDAADKQIANLNNSIKKGSYEQAAYNKELEKTRTTRELDAAAIARQNELMSLQNDIQQDAIKETAEYDKATQEGYKKRMEAFGEFGIARAEEYKAEREYQRSIMELAQEVNDIQLQKTAIENEKQDLKARYDARLLTYGEYAAAMLEIQSRTNELIAKEEENATKKTELELEKRKKIQEAYAASINSVVGSITSIIGSIGSVLEQGSKEWKAVMTAEAIISTIKGGIDAYMGMIQTIPGAAGIVAGAAAAAATLAAGWAEIRKIQATNVSANSSSSTSGTSSFSNVSASAVSVNATSVTPTRTVQTDEDRANLPDTRVYVTEEDITRAQRRVAVTYQNATY